jgi:DNA polymerase I-like protein with 3'-5' exonuclease and polymerase domains
MFNEWCRSIVQDVCDALETFRKDRYGEIFIEGRTLLRNLSTAHINSVKLKQYLHDEINATNTKTLLSFTPNHEGVAYQPIYDQLSTSTGRLILKTGPQVLTLPKKYRDLIASRYSGGAIYQVDFISLEPRVARLISGKPVGRDVYSSISRSIFENRLTRDETKLAVLCALYGVSSARLKNMLGEKSDAVSVIRKIKEFFGTSELLKNMSAQISKRGYVENWYGRKLNVQNESRHVWISHFIQSTATDAALIGFHRLINKIEKNELRVHGIFVIHDAILLDAHPDDEASLHELVREGIDLDEMGIFPLSMDIISRAQ